MEKFCSNFFYSGECMFLKIVDQKQKKPFEMVFTGYIRKEEAFSKADCLL